MDGSCSADVKQYGKAKYSIEELLRLGEGIRRDYRYRAVGARRRTLGVSSASLLGSGSSQEEDMINRTQSTVRPPVNYPHRQPRGPPEGREPQIQAGFARFLKEHSSPTHKRVTAGGRIVSAGPNSPPPTFRMDAIDDILKKSEGGKTLRPIQNRQGSERSMEQLPITPDHIAQISGHTVQLLPAKSMPPASQSQEQLYTPSHKSMNDPQWNLPVPYRFLAMKANQREMIIEHKGQTLLAVREGSNTILRTLQPEEMPAEVQEATRNGSVKSLFRAQSHSHLLTQVHPSQVNGLPQVPLQPSILPALVPSLAPSSLQSHYKICDEQQNDLQEKLNTLQKHLALNFEKLSIFDQSQLTATRKQLISAIDMLRKSKKRIESNFQMMTGYSIAFALDPTMPMPVLPTSTTQTIDMASVPAYTPYQPVQPPNLTELINSQQSSINMYNLQATQQHHLSQAPMFLSQPSDIFNPYQQAQLSALDSSGNLLSNSKRFSPEAPPFVPSNESAMMPNGYGTMQPSHSQDELSAATFTLRAQTAGGPLATETIQPALSSTSFTASLGDNRPEPVVFVEDLAYCEELSYNNPSEEKQYCTTANEMMEVIKTVREHASMYGCKGGQSKDPAWDAEQDVRWAMHDQLPIPLTPSIPDHVFQPRPWSWQDSYFNVRRGREAGWQPPRYLRAQTRSLHTARSVPLLASPETHQVVQMPEESRVSHSVSHDSMLSSNDFGYNLPTVQNIWSNREHHDPSASAGNQTTTYTRQASTTSTPPGLSSRRSSSKFAEHFQQMQSELKDTPNNEMTPRQRVPSNPISEFDPEVVKAVAVSDPTKPGNKILTLEFLRSCIQSDKGSSIASNENRPLNKTIMASVSAANPSSATGSAAMKSLDTLRMPPPSLPQYKAKSSIASPTFNARGLSMPRTSNTSDTMSPVSTMLASSAHSRTDPTPRASTNHSSGGGSDVSGMGSSYVNPFTFSMDGSGRTATRTPLSSEGRMGDLGVTMSRMGLRHEDEQVKRWAQGDGKGLGGTANHPAYGTTDW
ncbi:hypothetical protein MMC25_007735 [Agyrium rufum]|nr:hypothetical protein [Agyrium rufum]